MAAAEELLASYLRRFEISALGERLGPELAEKAIDAWPELAQLSRAGLESLLAGAAAEGVAALIASAELALQIEGPGPDPSFEALERTIENVRACLALICPPPGEELSLEERRARSGEAIRRLAELVNLWDRTQAPEPPEEQPRR